MAIGPLQLVVLGFDSPDFSGAVLDELDRLKDNDTVAVIDTLIVHKDANGDVEAVEASQLTEDEAMEFGAVVGALVGFGAAGEEGAIAGAILGAAAAEDGATIFTEEDTWDVIDLLPNDAAAALILLEHRWAIPLRDAVVGAGGFRVSGGFIRPLDLIELGLVTALEEEVVETIEDEIDE